MSRPRLVVVTPRPPLRDGQGDQRRAWDAIAALAPEWDIEVVSWLPKGEKPGPKQWLRRPDRIFLAAALAVTRPMQVAYFQAWAGWSLSRRLPAHDLALFITNRAVPPRYRGPYVIDFVDDLSSAATTRSAFSKRFRAVLEWEARRLRRLDRRLAAGALLAVAVSQKDAAAISPSVQTIPIAMATSRGPNQGNKVVFSGNLFFAPNREAALWICTELVPRLRAAGIAAADVVIAGRRPHDDLRDKAAEAGVDFRPDVPDLAEVIAEAAVVVVPVTFGSGAQIKIIDAVAAQKPCVITPFANQAYGLVDGESVLVRDRSPEAFAEAVVRLVSDPSLGRDLARAARQHLGMHSQEAVHEAWRQSLRAALGRIKGGGSDRTTAAKAGLRRAGSAGRPGTEDHVRGRN